jgi:hypothetical protein
MLCWSSFIFWDTLAYFVGQPISVGWLILIPTAVFHGPAHPFSMVTMQLKGAYNRIQRLDKVINLSPVTFIQYQSLEAQKLRKEMETEDKKEKRGPCLFIVN